MGLMSFFLFSFEKEVLFRKLLLISESRLQQVVPCSKLFKRFP